MFVNSVYFIEKYYIFLISYFLLITLLLLSTIYIFRKLWIRKTKKRNLIINFSTFLFPILYLLLIFEGITAYLPVKSDGLNYTLTSRRWFSQYWNPINSYGYRDYEPQWKSKIAFIVGDSFVAGHGIRNIDDRFSNKLAKKLDDNWTVTILAKNGWNPKNYITALEIHDKKPDLIVISYFVNDIESAAYSVGFPPPKLIDYPNKILSIIVERSYLANYIYWGLYRNIQGDDKYFPYLRKGYNNNAVWKKHTKELDRLIDYSHHIDAKVVFIVWPYSLNASKSKEITSKVSHYLHNRDIPVIDLHEYYATRNLEQLVASPMDGHPNETVNADVSEILYQLLQKMQ